MKPEIKELWIKELRSGVKAQGKQFLKTQDGKYCCMGVLCEIAVAEGVINPPVWAPEAEAFEYCWAYGADPGAGVLPEEVVTWAGLDQTNPEVLHTDEKGEKYRIDVSVLNDTLGCTFEQIADLIEEQL